MAYQLKRDLEFLRIVFSGILTQADLQALILETDRQEKETGRVPNRLADFRLTTEFAVNYDVIQTVTGPRRAKRFANPFKTAILTANSVQNGYARMFQILNDNPQIETQIFTDEALALQWLAQTVGVESPRPRVNRDQARTC